MAGEQYEILLAWQKAHLTVEAAEGLTTDMVIKAVWENIPIGLTDGAIQWAKTNRKTVTTPPVEYKDFTGTWRLMRCETPLNPKTGLKTLAFYYAKGWVTTLLSGSNIDFTEARLAEKQSAGRELIGNTQAVTGVGGTTSDNPEKYVLVEWHNCSSDHSQAMIAEIGGTSVVTNLSADGQSYTGTYHVVYAAYAKDEDGSIIISALFAQPQYTLKAYENVLTAKGKDKYYLWNVPKDSAQTILDSWGATAGRSASCSYSTDQGLVDLILTSQISTSASFTTTVIRDGCDHYMVYYYGWGMTQAELDAFIKLHDGTTTTPDTYSISRELSINMREDGTFDVIIRERYFGPHASPATPDLTFDLPVGTVTVETYNYGWNLRLSEMASVLALYDKDSVPAVAGQRRILRITREDDCSFDYEGIFIVYSERSATLATSNTDGIETSIQNVKFAAALPAAPTSAKRKRYRLDADQNDVGTFDYTVASETVKQTADQDIETSGSTGINTKIRYGKNQDAEPAITKAARKHISGQIQANDDGSLDHVIVEETVLATTNNLETTGTANQGINFKSLYGKNEDIASVPAITKAYRKRTSGQVVPNDDGTVDHQIVEQTVALTTDTFNVGNVGENIRIDGAQNSDPLADPGTPIAGQLGINKQLQFDFDDDGTIHYKLITLTKVEQEENASYGTMLDKQEIIIATNDVSHLDADLLLANGDAGAIVAEGISVQLQLDMDVDGAIQRRMIKSTSIATISTPAITTARYNPNLDRYGYVDTCLIFRNTRAANLADGVGKIGLAATPEYGQVVNFRMNDDGTYDAIKILRTYMSTGIYTAVTFSKEDKTYNLIYKHYDSEDPVASLWTWTFTAIEEKWFDDFGDAIDHIDDGFHSNIGNFDSRILGITEINRIQWWHTIKYPTPAYTTP